MKKIELQPSGIILAFKILTVEIVAAIAYLVLIIINTYSPGVIVSVTERAAFEVFVFLLLLMIRMVAIAIVIVEWQNIKYVFTENELVKTTGILTKTVKRYNLDQLESLSCHRTLVGSLAEYGTISLKLRLNDDRIFLPHINKPENIIEEVSVLTSSNKLTINREPVAQNVGKIIFGTSV